ncbi:hypothetical protein [Pseudoalteromonas sp. 2CM28B]|uniref:hypothetical protein n=1 Tax=Pseudoalteromonas sp. 2CM28B TaxID=2929851 RepID=UPI0020C00678|nr:hypothetical protein [Pseudoalteromonas sp. 2CM28B]MCK8132673.1 hypothetical protein [Pseudoalteromonas sp. 2CM28B]
MKSYNLIQQLKSKDWLNHHVAYFHETLFSLTDNSFSEIQNTPKIIIVARQYYTESWQTYPSISLKELKELLKLQNSNKQNKITKTNYTKNEQQEGFDVKTIEFNEFISTRFSQSFLIPETDLIAHSYERESIAMELNTPAGVLFYAQAEGKAHSTYKRGLVSSLDIFSLSVGLSDNAKRVQLESSQYSKALLSTLKNYPLSKLNKLISSDFTKSVNLNMLHAIYWAPMITATLFILIMNGYFMLQHNTLEEKLSAKNQQISTLLAKQKHIDETNRYVSDVSNELTSVPRVLSHFQIAYEAINAGMEIQQFKGGANEIMIRGFANSASTVLSAISELPELSSAQFNGPVRKSGKRDYFVMTLKLATTNEK